LRNIGDLFETLPASVGSRSVIDPLPAPEVRADGCNLATPPCRRLPEIAAFHVSLPLFGRTKIQSLGRQPTARLAISIPEIPTDSPPAHFRL
jgi:hypothetical protein